MTTMCRIGCYVCLLAGTVFAQTEEKAKLPPAPPTNQAKPAAAAETAATTPSPQAAHTQAELERKLSETLTGVTFEGTWQMTGEGGLRSSAPLTPARPEKYVITRASKGLGDNWVITARIQFADKDVEIPVPVRVVWAGDTPVITLDEISLPVLGTYSARVMIHEGFYSGIWYSKAKNYGGVMSGRINKEPPNAEPPPATPPK